MQPRRILSFATGLLFVATAGLVRPHDEHAATTHPSVCTCTRAKLEHQWCAKCRVGYIAGTRVTSLTVFEAMDAHGHKIDRASLRCESCRRAVETDGYCEKCRLGFVGGLLYFSPLTHGLARGKAWDANQFGCEVCRRNARAGGWCESCTRGIVGNVELRDREVFERTQRAYQLFTDSLKLIDKCETCAAAMALNGSCPTCRVSYENGARKASPSR